MKYGHIAFSLTVVAALSACSSMGIGGGTATAKLDGRSGTSTGGTVTFTQSGDHLIVKADVTGMVPGSEHGFHVHEKGDCSSPDAMSAGGHFNPTGMQHGPTASPSHHAGDIPNLRADATGRAQATFELKDMSLSGANSVVGRAVVVHKDPDDYKSQPAGNSGARIACGVIAQS